MADRANRTHSAGEGKPADRANRTHSASGGKRASRSASVHTSTAVTTDNSDAKQARAIIAYRKLGNVGAACIAAGVARRTWYDWIENDPSFAVRLNDAREDAADELEAIAHQRAQTKSGDRLLIFLLRALRPSKYREGCKIGVVSPIVKEKVAQTVHVIRSQLPKELADPLLQKLAEVWR